MPETQSNEAKTLAILETAYQIISDSNAPAHKAIPALGLLQSLAKQLKTQIEMESLSGSAQTQA